MRFGAATVDESNEPNEESRSPYAGLAKKIRQGKTPAALEMESTPPTIRITRTAPPSGIRSLFALGELLMSAKTFSVTINQQARAELKAGESVKLEVQPGLHNIIVSTSVASAGRQVELEMGGKVAYLCGPTMSGIYLTRRD